MQWKWIPTQLSQLRVWFHASHDASIVGRVLMFIEGLILQPFPIQVVLVASVQLLM